MKLPPLRRILFFVLLAAMFVLPSQISKAESPRIGVALIGPYLDEGAVTLEYKVTNYEDHPIVFEDHHAMQGVIEGWSSSLQSSYVCPERVVKLDANGQYRFKIDLTDLPAGTYHATFSASNGGTNATNKKEFVLPVSEQASFHGIR